jgi:hypothetical protein
MNARYCGMNKSHALIAVYCFLHSESFISFVRWKSVVHAVRAGNNVPFIEVIAFSAEA